MDKTLADFQAEVERLRLQADDYAPAAMDIIGRKVLRVSDRDEDRHQATDFVTITMQPMRIACRIRSHEYLARYPYDVTLRLRHQLNCETEWQKISAGHGDWLFYGFASTTVGELAQWCIVDLNLLRRVWHDFPEYRDAFSEHKNGDGSAMLTVDLRRLPAMVVIDSSHPIPREETP